jgi:hypothetical protein
VLDISAATAPGNILSRTESLKTESTSALNLSDLFAFIANWPSPAANDTLIEVTCRSSSKHFFRKFRLPPNSDVVIAAVRGWFELKVGVVSGVTNLESPGRWSVEPETTP